MRVDVSLPIEDAIIASVDVEDGDQLVARVKEAVAVACEPLFAKPLEDGDFDLVATASSLFWQPSLPVSTYVSVDEVEAVAVTLWTRLDRTVVVQVGDPRLRQDCLPVEDVTDAVFVRERDELLAALARFRREAGFGRAIAAPQIGICKRFIAVNMGDERGAFVMINPVIVWRSEELFKMYDDCMSSPWVLSKLTRHVSVSVKWTDADGVEQLSERLPQAESELYQHELDHLDGTLCIDLNEDGRGLVSRAVYEQSKAFQQASVDPYAIEPTLDEDAAGKEAE